MNYLYYPGCSLNGTGKGYNESVRAVFETLGVNLHELEDWNCCGATAYMAISELKAFALSARNLALAEKQMEKFGATDMIAPCAACYLVLSKTQHYLNDYEKISDKVRSALAAAGLSYEGKIRIRHPLDVLVKDIGIDKIKSSIKQPLSDYNVASYYGCQIVRPYSTFDDQYNPQSMDSIMQALGAKAVDWPLKTRCCGCSLTGTIEEDVGVRLCYILLKEAQKRGANVMATACPLCQFNLECYQTQIRKTMDKKINLSIVYFTQLIGLALGIDKRKLGMQRLFVPPKEDKLAARMEGGQSARI
jgi:heterodisulfide reductase subunit B